MKAIGFRASPSEITYALVSKEGNQFEIQTDVVTVPHSLEMPERLNFLRSTIKDLIIEFSPTIAAIRVTEANAQNLNMERISYEAILQEAICTTSIERYFILRIPKWAPMVGMSAKDLKEILKSHGGSLFGKNLSPYKNAAKESVVAALAAINQ
jgi:hypothetical protein